LKLDDILLVACFFVSWVLLAYLGSTVFTASRENDIDDFNR
jgi:hypothetical protein